MFNTAILFSLITAVIFISGCTGDQQTSGETAAKPVPVTTAPVVYRQISRTIERSGLLATGSEARLSFKIGGIVRQILVDEGASVSDGQLLAVLNLSEIKAQVELARAAYEKAVRDQDRVSRLYRDSVATLEALQDTRTARDAAKANLEIANFNLQHARIVAPANGRILKRFVEENEMVGPGTPVFYFGSSETSWIVRLGVTDRELVSLALGDSAEVTFDAYPRKKFNGTVTEISESVDARSGTFEIEVTLADEKARLVSGFVARTAIFPAKKAGHFLVPVEALVEAEKDSAYIYLLAGGAGQVTKRKVPVGEIIGDQVIILAQLKTTDRVITAGGAYLTDESKIIQVDTNK